LRKIAQIMSDEDASLRKKEFKVKRNSFLKLIFYKNSERPYLSTSHSDR
jgi:hypothetical protein